MARRPARFAKLPEPERAGWIKLWEEVDALLAKVAKL